MCRACADDAQLARLCRERHPESLRRLYLFRDLTDEQLEAAIESLATVPLSDGRWLFRQGDRADRFYLVREGQIALFRQSVEGKENIVALLGPDEMFAETLIFLDDAQHDLNARALGSTTLLSFDRSLFRTFLSESPKLCFSVMATLHRRQQMLLDEIERLTLQDATQRVMAYLLDQVAGRHGPQRLQLTVPKSVLASRLSIQPETLSRILARLKECEYVSEEEDALVVPHPEQLQAGLTCSLCSLRFWGCPGPQNAGLNPSSVHSHA